MIQVRDLVFGYNTSRKIIDQISFDVEDGHCIAILGNNGAGKSTMRAEAWCVLTGWKSQR